MPTNEQYESYFIKKIEELRKSIKELEAVVYHKTLKEACNDHLMIAGLGASDAVIKEKNRVGEIGWSFYKDKRFLLKVEITRRIMKFGAIGNKRAKLSYTHSLFKTQEIYALLL